MLGAIQPRLRQKIRCQTGPSGIQTLSRKIQLQIGVMRPIGCLGRSDCCIHFVPVGHRYRRIMKICAPAQHHWYPVQMRLNANGGIEGHRHRSLCQHIVDIGIHQLHTGISRSQPRQIGACLRVAIARMRFHYNRARIIALKQRCQHLAH